MLGTLGRGAVRDSLAYRTYCDPWHLFIVTPIAERLTSGAVTTCFNELGLSRLGFEHPTIRFRAERSNQLRHRRGSMYLS